MKCEDREWRRLELKKGIYIERGIKKEREDDTGVNDEEGGAERDEEKR